MDPVHHGQAEPWGGWHWDAPRDGEHFRCCSYCGSIHPEDLANEPRWHADWADMKYGWPHKFYVQVPNRDPDKLYCVGVSGSYQGDWIRGKDLNRKQRKAVKRTGHRRIERESYYLLRPKRYHFAKLYTVHLADPALPAEAKLHIEQVAGLHFTFAEGKVRWRPAAGTTASDITVTRPPDPDRPW